MSKIHDMKLQEAEYQDFIKRLNTLLNHVSNSAESKGSEEISKISEYLQQFKRHGTINFQTLESTMNNSLDEYSRSYTKASKKTSKAQVWMIPGTGQVYVNSIHFSDYFPLFLLSDIISPFEKSNQMGVFNVWAVVNGGGISSQAVALKTAIARGINIHHPELQDTIPELKSLAKIDTRQVERKKTGQPKARKKIAWVKR